MTTFNGGTKVSHGFYLNTTTWAHTDIADTGTLPGAQDERWVRIPLAVALAAAPVLGLAMVIFLPTAGIAMVLGVLAMKLARGAEAAFMKLASVLAPSWAPGVAYFAARRRARAEQPASTPPAAPAPRERLDALLEDIEAKRENDEPKA